MKKLLGIVVLGLLWCNIGVAACIEGNCIDGKGTYMWTSGKLTGDKYLGQFKDGKMHGQGTYTYLNGDRYIGYFKNGEEHGDGFFKSTKQGTSYVGQFKDGFIHGRGVFELANGKKYIGQFKYGTITGQGTMLHTDGTIDIGIFKDGKLIERKY